VSAGPLVHVGCGSSRIIATLPASFAIDSRLNKLRWLQPRHPRVAQADADRLPFRDGSLGTLVVSNIDDGRLHEAARVLRPGGTLSVDTVGDGHAPVVAGLARHGFDVLDVRDVARRDIIVRARRRG
jgi:SAM-dependent methyltransferase